MINAHLVALNKGGSPMTTLDPNDGYVVLINTFKVEPDRAEELLGVLSRATEHGMRHRPGFVSANLHMSQDCRRVANYAQWRSQADLNAMMADPAARVHMQEAAAIATSFDPIYYALRESHAAAPA
jgi:quinol monooxygenase YgiN